MSTKTPSRRKSAGDTIRTYRGFNSFLRATLGKYLVRTCNVKALNLDIFSRLSAPYVILPNHQNFWDPFFVSTFVPDPVYYVTSDANFRSPLLRFLLGLVGSIPKTKQMSDLETVKNIMRIRDRKGVIGVFPEGRRSWDGHTLPLLYATAKLVRLLKIPVVIPLLRGAYLSGPRWSKHPKRGEVTIDFRLCCTGEEAAKLPVDEIFRKMTGHLEYDEYEWQRGRMIPFTGKKPAEHLELTLFVCPSCGRIGSLVSKGDGFSCAGCGYAVRYDGYGFFRPVSGGVIHETVRDWNLWQQGFLRSFVGKKLESGDETPVISDRNSVLLSGYKMNPLRKLYFGEVVLYTDRIEFVPLRRARLVFPLREVSGMNIQNGERLEFYFRSVLYSFRFPSGRISSYKWVSACSAIGEAWHLETVGEKPVGEMPAVP